MSVEQQTQRVLYQGNGTATEFPFTFSVYAANQVRVVTATADGIETERAYNNEFTVSLASSGSGGTVTYPVSGDALAVGEKIAVISAIPSTQEKTFPNNTPFYQEQIEGALDKNTRLVQQLEELSVRAVKIPETSSDDPAELVRDVYIARSDAQTSAANAAVSETNAGTSETNAAAWATLAQVWAESDTAPGGTGTKSAKAWAGEAARHSVVMTGATAEAAGLAGLVPAPAAGDQGALLTGGGFYQSFSASPAAGVVPQAGADGRLAVGWIPGVFTGDIRFLPFRADALPYGWYSMNGELYTVNSAPGAALLALPETFRTDWGIAVSGDGATVNVPDWFATDGRGPVMRAVDGTDRQVGTIEQDAAYELDFPVGYRNGGIDDYSGLYPPLYNRVDSSQRIAGIFTGNATKTAPVTWFKMSLVENTATEIRILNRGMTPAIFLGA